MFVMGFLGRCFQNTGTVPDLKTLRDMVYQARLAWEIEMEGRTEPGQEIPMGGNAASNQELEGGYSDRNPPPQDFTQ